MKVDAVAIGPLDLAAGLAFLQTSYKQGFPWLSANLLDPKGQPLFQPSRITKIGKIRAGIIGLTGAVSSLPADVTRGEWQTIVPPLIEQIAPQCDILILLSSLSPAENQEIARQFPAIHLILTADPNSGNMVPQQVNNSLITQIDRQGKYQGILTIEWDTNGRWGKSLEEEVNGLRNQLGALDWQLQRMRERKDLQQPEYLDKIKLIEQNRESVEQQVKALEKPGPGLANGEKPASTFSHNFLALQQTMTEAPEIKTLVAEIKQQINTLHLHTIRKAEPLPFLGPDGCKKCHAKQTGFWQTTRHAQAYQTLQKQDQALNLECLPCHVIASPELALSRDQLLTLQPSLQAVSCENCHNGPGAKHAGNPKQFPMTRQVEEKICLTCHTKEHDNHFEYQKKRALIACPSN